MARLRELTSVLANHELTDQIPATVRIAIGPKDWRPIFLFPPARFVHFPSIHLRTGVEDHTIDGVDVPIFGIAKTIADLFRYRRIVGVNDAPEGLREALRK
jgi:predicted transcriptional regulator of viral defense system